jgi:hypothetical protein
MDERKQELRNQLAKDYVLLKSLLVKNKPTDERVF